MQPIYVKSLSRNIFPIDSKEQTQPHMSLKLLRGNEKNPDTQNGKKLCKRNIGTTFNQKILTSQK